MFDIPGFFPKAMTDDELLDRVSQLTAKLNAAYSLGFGYPTERMQLMIDVMNAERQERLLLANWQHVAPLVNQPLESDPGLHDLTNSAADKPTFERPSARNRQIVRRTLTPGLDAPPPDPEAPNDE